MYNMDSTLTIEAIKETATYKELVSKKEHAKYNFLETRVSRARMTHAFTVYKNRGFIPNTLRCAELPCVQDLIRMQQTDRSFDMTSEEINLYDV